MRRCRSFEDWNSSQFLEHVRQACSRLQTSETLGLDSLPSRISAFDQEISIAHTAHIPPHGR